MTNTNSLLSPDVLNEIIFSEDYENQLFIILVSWLKLYTPLKEFQYNKIDLLIDFISYFCF